MKAKFKKGFTLIEMLVVIAIIAILVSIVIPVVSQSTNRSASAVNAANLRAVYGKLSTMKLLDPDAFQTNLENGEHHGINIGDGSFIGNLLSKIPLKHYAIIRSNNGQIRLPSGHVIDAIPSARVVTYDGGFTSKSVKVEEGTEMTVIITDDYIITLYGMYTIENFADIAEDNKLDGSTGIAFDKYCVDKGGHTFIHAFWGDYQYCLLCGYRKN